jgi:outer membrane lipoprotein-sorting protein
VKRGTRIVIALFGAVLLPVSTAFAQAAPDVKAIVRLLDDLFRSSASIGQMKLTAKTETQNRILKMRIWTKGTEKSLIIIDEPAREAGTATLKVGNNLWNYLPKISRTIRIPPSMMLSSWMGTDFTNDDLVKSTSYLNDFDTHLEGRSADPVGWKYVMNVRPGVVGRWQKIIFILNNDGTLPIQAQYFNRKGQLARTMRFLDVKTMGGRLLPTHLSLESVDQPGHQTDIYYLEMQFNAAVPDSTFSLSQLERQ